MQRYKLTKARMNSVKAKKKEREGDGTGEDEVVTFRGDRSLCR